MTDIGRLVSKLDLNAKIGQIQGVVPMDLVDWASFGSADGDPVDLDKGFPADVERLPLVRPHGVGHLSLGWQLSQDLEELRVAIARFQEVARDVNPFGIATLVHAEGISGLVHAQGHQFPTAWGQAATWDPRTSQLVGDTAARQAQVVGVHLLFSPLLDIARDIRWGRVHETYGEDPELVARMGIGFVQGVHGDEARPRLLATGKHFLAYGHSAAALNQATTQLGERELTDVYAEPFRRAIAEADLSVVMNSYNEIDGIPAVANRWLLDELLRGALGFDGLVVSDYGSISMLTTTYRTASSSGGAAAQALTAGIDVELPSADMTNDLQRVIEEGWFSEEILDRAVERVLRTKASLGLVPEVRPPHAAPAPAAIDHREALDRARAIAGRSITLLANDGTLPLTPGASKIAVVGQAADEIRVHFGAYSSVADVEMPAAIARIIRGEVPGIDPQPEVFPDLFQTRLPGVEPAFEEAARRLHPEAETVLEAIRRLAPDATYHPYGHLGEASLEVDLDRLVTEVADADVIIAVVGERTGWVGNHTAGEGRTVADPTLPGDQNRVIAALRHTTARLVTIVVSGRPLLLEPVDQASAAVVLAPLLGQVAGSTIADVLFGATEPGGRTPSTFPRHVGQIPMYHGHPIGSGYDHPTKERHGYIDLSDSTPLYPFGHGLTYTDFVLTLDEATLVDDELSVRATVENVGARSGTAVIQLYARDESASVVRPVRQLIDFARVPIDSGDAASIVLGGPVERLAYSWPDGQRGVEAGDVTLLLGFSSADIRHQATIDVSELMVRPER